MSYDPRSRGAKCDSCPLNGSVAVPPVAADKPRLVVIGEAPGRHEARHGEPFIGPSGLLLDRLIADSSEPIPRRAIHLTNAVLCRPDNERDLKAATACCNPRLANELAAVDPSTVLLALGGVALGALTGGRNIMKARGFVWEVPEPSPTPKAKRAGAVEWGKACRSLLHGRRFVPTFHPAFLLRGAETWKPVVAADIDRALRLAAGNIVRLDDQTDYGEVRTVTALRKALRGFGSVVEVDAETDDKDPLTCNITLIGLGDVAGLERRKRGAIVAAWWKPGMGRALSRFLRGRRVVWHNGEAFDALVCERHGIQWEASDDTLIATHAVNSHLRKGLDSVAARYTDAAPWKLMHRGKAVAEKGAFNVAPESLAEYNAADIRLGGLVWLRMAAGLAEERAVYEHDMRMAVVCRGMQRRGFLVDQDRRLELARKMKRREAALLGMMRRLAGANFRPGASRSIRAAIYDRMGVVVWKITPKGDPSTDRSVLEALRVGEGPAAELADYIIRWRTARDVRKEYLENIVIGNDGAVHAAWRGFGTRSGRPAARDPNILNTPRTAACSGCGITLIDRAPHRDWCKRRDRPEPHSQVRDIYVARPGYRLVYFDLSQAEMRFAAHLSGDPNFMAACAKDVHAGNAIALFPYARQVLEEDPKGKGKPFRDIAKNVGFAISYLAESSTVFAYLRGKGFQVSLTDIEAALGRLRLAYRVYYDWVAANQAFCETHGYLRSCFLGRIHWLGWHPKPTEVANFPIQSGVADVMNRYLIDTAPKVEALGAFPLIYAYDSVTYECPVGRVGALKAMVADYWSRPIVVPHNGVSFTQPCDLKDGLRWSDFG